MKLFHEFLVSYSKDGDLFYAEIGKGKEDQILELFNRRQPDGFMILNKHCEDCALKIGLYCEIRDDRVVYKINQDMKRWQETKQEKKQ